MKKHEILNYVEFPACDLSATKAFFEACFGWVFEDYGDTYTAFSSQGFDGGFYVASKASRSQDGAALLVFFSEDLEASMEKIDTAGGTITQEIFAFPGGRRFHFTEPSGNEFAVWSDRD